MTSTRQQRTSGRNSRTALLSVVFVVLLLVALLLGTFNGATEVTLKTISSLLTTPSQDWSTTETILYQVRIPRVLTAAFVGAGLAFAGVVMQTALRNPLAEPYLLGISSGASFGAVCVLIVGIPVALPVAGLTGGLLALAITLALGQVRQSPSTTRVILAGIAVTAFFSALTSFVIFQSKDNDSYRQMLHWLLGSLSSVTWNSVIISGSTLAILGGVLILGARLLEILLLTDEEIYSIGKNADFTRISVLVLASILAAGMVSVAGSIGFVGLIVPHIVRRLARLTQRRLLIISGIAGALLLTLADTFSRTIMAPQELPVGITTAILGSIVFAFLMVNKNVVKI